MGPATQALGAVAIRRHSLVSLAIAITLLLAALAACGGGGGEQAPPATTSPTIRATRATTASPSATPGLGEPQFDSARALEHALALSVDIGIRAAGTDGERQGASYIRDQLSSYGYEASLQPFPFESFIDRTRLELLSPEARAMQAAALSQSAAGPAEGALIDAGLGRPEDFSADASGKIALIKRGVLFFEDKVSNAEQAGAAAAIIYNNSSGIFRGSLKDASAIPAVSISEEDGQALLDLMLNAPTPVTVRLDVQTETVIGESQNVVARPREGQCRLIAGGHYDSVPEGPGANDNASGTATVIEIARVLAADGDLDDVCFALFGAEEIGLVGSAHYVAALTADEKGEVEAMLNFDMLGVGDSWPLTGSRGVADVAGAEAERLGISHTVETALPENLGSDHQSFIQAGIPAMIFNCFCDENYHTADDRFELVRGARLAEAGAIALGTISALLGG